jgi:hypothetical protein
MIRIESPELEWIANHLQFLGERHSGEYVAIDPGVSLANRTLLFGLPT